MPGQELGIGALMYLEHGGIVGNVDIEIVAGEAVTPDPVPEFGVEKVTYYSDAYRSYVAALITNPYNDIVDFDDQPGSTSSMQLVYDVEDGSAVDFQFVTGSTQNVTPLTYGGYLDAQNVGNCTGSSGKGTWGGVSGAPLATRSRWDLYY